MQPHGAWWPLRRSGSLPSGDSREGSLALTPLTAVIQLVNRRTSAAAATAADWGDDNTRSPHAWGKLRSIAGKELRSQVHMGASIAVCCSGAVDSNIRLAVCTGTTGVAVYSLRADGCLTRAAQLEIPGAGGADGLPASPAAHPRTRRYTTDGSPSFNRSARAKAEGLSILSVELNGSLLAVGAPGNRLTRLTGQPAGGYDGEVWLFEWNRRSREYSRVAMLLPADAPPGHGGCFGATLSADARSGRLVVGAPLMDGAAGCVYVFRRVRGRRWCQTARLVSPDANAYSNACFGSAVGLHGRDIFAASASGIVYHARWESSSISADTLEILSTKRWSVAEPDGRHIWICGRTVLAWARSTLKVMEMPANGQTAEDWQEVAYVERSRLPLDMPINCVAADETLFGAQLTGSAIELLAVSTTE